MLHRDQLCRGWKPQAPCCPSVIYVTPGYFMIFGSCHVGDGGGVRGEQMSIGFVLPDISNFIKQSMIKHDWKRFLINLLSVTFPAMTPETVARCQFKGSFADPASWRPPGMGLGLFFLLGFPVAQGLHFWETQCPVFCVGSLILEITSSQLMFTFANWTVSRRIISLLFRSQRLGPIKAAGTNLTPQVLGNLTKSSLTSSVLNNVVRDSLKNEVLSPHLAARCRQCSWNLAYEPPPPSWGLGQWQPSTTLSHAVSSHLLNSRWWRGGGGQDFPQPFLYFRGVCACERGL